jgi:methylmalonyl-CoA/ethylmalonyl-CoA epimerase
MNEIEKNLLPFGEFDHIGIIVRDIEKAVRHYQSLGAGPFTPLKGDVSEIKLRGAEAGQMKIEGRIGPLGSIKVELIQPVYGQSLHMEFLQNKGEGISHVCFRVNNLEKAAAVLTAKGFPVISSRKFSHGGGNMYFDTSLVGGAYVELLQPPE